MGSDIVAQLAGVRGRNLDQPDLAQQSSAGYVWQAWVPAEALVELPWEAEELIDAASAELGHLHGPGWLRAYAWERAEAAAWGLAQPLPQAMPPPAWRPARQRSRAIRTFVRVKRALAKGFHRASRRR